MNITTEADLFKAEIILPKLEMREKKEENFVLENNAKE